MIADRIAYRQRTERLEIILGTIQGLAIPLRDPEPLRVSVEELLKELLDERRATYYRGGP